MKQFKDLVDGDTYYIAHTCSLNVSPREVEINKGSSTVNLYVWNNLQYHIYPDDKELLNSDRIKIEPETYAFTSKQEANKFTASIKQVMKEYKLK